MDSGCQLNTTLPPRKRDGYAPDMNELYMKKMHDHEQRPGFVLGKYDFSEQERMGGVRFTSKLGSRGCGVEIDFFIRFMISLWLIY